MIIQAYKAFDALFSRAGGLASRHDARKNLRKYVKIYQSEDFLDINEDFRGIEAAAERQGALYAFLLGTFIRPKRDSLEEMLKMWQLGCKMAGVVPKVMGWDDDKIELDHDSCLPYCYFKEACDLGKVGPENVNGVGCYHSCFPLVRKFTEKLSQGTLQLEIVQYPRLSHMCYKNIARAGKAPLWE